MTTYVGKPSIVEAVLYDGKNKSEVEALCDSHNVGFAAPGPDPALSSLARHYAVMTLAGRWTYLGEGDWLVIDPDLGAIVYSADMFADNFGTPVEAIVKILTRPPLGVR